METSTYLLYWKGWKFLNKKIILMSLKNLFDVNGMVHIKRLMYQTVNCYN